MEFSGGPGAWVTKTYSAAKGRGANLNGSPIAVSREADVTRSLLVCSASANPSVAFFGLLGEVSQVVGLLADVSHMAIFFPIPRIEPIAALDEQVTGFGYEHDEAWAANLELFKDFTDVSRGVRRLGAAAVDLCHVALGEHASLEQRRVCQSVFASAACAQDKAEIMILCARVGKLVLAAGVVDAYWEYRLKPWDMAAGVIIAQEAGATITTMEGQPFTVFSRSVLAANPGIHSAILAKTQPKTEGLRQQGVDLSPWFVPEGYKVPA